ncbi:MAG TPA: SDR family oxidoreductase [Thermodesulfobacteriota bacterium]
MDLGLAGRRAIVAGGSMGIGKGAATLLATEGARVAIIARGREALDAAAAEIAAAAGRPVVTVQADLSTRAEAERAVGEAVGRLGGLDILVNSLGAARSGEFLDLEEEDWVFSLESKLLAQVRVTRAALPYLRANGFGRIVCVNGHRGWDPDPDALPSSVANAGLNGFVKGLGRKLAAENVFVTAVSPPPMQTRRLDYLVDARARIAGISREAAREAFLREIPAGRFATPEEVAPLIAFLASPRNTYVTATTIAIDGGTTRGI